MAAVLAGLSWLMPMSAAAQNVKAIAALFDTRLTPVRSDDSLIVQIPIEIFSFNEVYYLNDGAPVADLPFEAGGVYRLVFQINPTIDWDFEPKETGKGLCALAGTAGRFGRAAAPIPGVAELLLTNTFVADENTDPIDFLVGMTKKFTPRVPWSMVTDPYADPSLEDKTAEIGSLKNTVPLGTFIDCIDDDKDWELSGTCEKERYYFYELWFKTDLDWENGDTADVYLHLEGKPVPTNIDQLHMRFRLVDDDAIPPAISDFSPEIVPAGLGFNISCRISDPSGVYDDGTGSSGQGVYLLWDDDGSIADGAHEILMSPVGEGFYATDAQIGARSAGDEIVYAVHACDNDADGGRIDDRSCVASDVRTVQILGSVYLFDELESLYPAAAYIGEEGVSIHLELNNPMPQGFVLHRTSTVSFSDGIRNVTANLRNETTVPAGASHFPVSFDAVQVPFDFIAPDTVDLMLDFTGTYFLLPFSQSWIASASNRLTVMKPRLLFTARPVASGDVHPGDEAVQLLRIDVKNDSPGAVSIDSLVISNVTTGGGGAPLNDVDFGPLRLYARSGEFARNDEMLRDSLAAVAAAGDGVEATEGDPVLGAAVGRFDSLLAWAAFEGGEARLRFPGGAQIPAGTIRHWYAVADVDSFLASDGDSLDLAIVSPDSVFVTGGASVEFSNAPVNSDGKCAIDGFKSFQLVVEETIPDTLYLGDADQPVLSFVIPVNGHVPDVLSAVSIGNFGDGEVDDLVERLALWRDDGDSLFSPSSDLHVGDLAATGDRFDLSGLSLSLSAPQRFFVVADFALGTFGVLEARFGVPAGGIEYLSQNDGPIDSDVAPGVGQVLLRPEIVSIDALPIPVGARHPGDKGIELLALRVGNNTLGGVTVDSFRVRGDSTLFPCEPGKPFALYADDGDSSFEPGIDTVVAEAVWNGGVAFFAGMGLAIAPGAQRILYVVTALDSFLTVDGETLSVGIESADDIGLTLAPSTSVELFRLDADFPLVSAGSGVTDGMLAHQITLYPLGDGVIADRKENVLVLDFLVPGNACLDDTLKNLRITNHGTAGNKQIERLRLWRDGGDGLFDPASDSLVAVFGEKAAKTYAAEALSEPLAGVPGSRFFVTMDVFEKVETGGTVDLAIPVMGVDVASGDDGAIDREIGGSGIFTIPVPDRLTIFTSILGNKRVLPGEKNVLNLALGIYNSYDESKTLQRLVLLSIGSSQPAEISKVEAYADSDDDGLFNPAIDSPLEIAQPGEAGYSFRELGVMLRPFRSTLIFISYDAALVGIRDSVRIDFQVSDKSSIIFLGTPPVIQGDFPLNSAGIDITNGMVNAQIEMLPVSSARVSPGAVDIPCLSFVLPCDGILEDVLEGFSAENRGTASQAQDVRYIKLWKDAGNTQFAFDRDDEFLAFLVWDGSLWKTVTPLAEPIPCEGLVLHVTADIASTAQDGRSLNLCVPLGGVVVSSGNDGPIDGRACGAAMIEISTDPLFVSFEVPAAVTRDQVFEVRMGVANAADTMLLGVAPDSFAWAGTGSCSSVSGPAPASIDLAGGSDSSFTWTFQAQSTGEIVFRGRVKQDAGLEASRAELSDSIRVDEIPTAVTVAMRDLAPVSLNRGQEDAPMMEMTIGYHPASGLGAPITFSSMEVSFSNQSGSPLPVRDAASRIRLQDKWRVLCSVQADTIILGACTLTLPGPVTLRPGDSTVFKLSLDVPSSAAAQRFRISIQSPEKLVIADGNSGAPIPFTGTTFPWSTNTVTLNDAANTLTMNLMPRLPARVNRGQDNVVAFAIVLANGGPASTAPMSVSELAFTVRDEAGDSVDAGKVLRVFRLDGAGGNTYASVENFDGSATIRCVLQPPVTVSAQLPVALTAVAGCLSGPSVTGFSVSLDDSMDVAVRDANSGRPVRVAASAPGFPMSSGAAVFYAPLEGVEVAGTGLLAERIMAGSAGVPVLRLVLRHPGTAGESPFSCTGMTVRVLDEAGRALDSNVFLDVVRVRLNGVAFASAYVTSGTGSDISVDFSSPLLVEPGGVDTLDVFVDLDAAPSPSRFQMQVNPTGLRIADATDGRSAIDIAGAFPLASGIGRIIFPAAQTLFDADALLPANVAVGEENHCMRLRFARATDSSGSRVFVERIVFDVLGEDGRPVDPSRVIETLRITGESGEIALSSAVEDGRLAVAMLDTVAIGENETREFVLEIATVASPGVKMLGLCVTGPSDVLCRDEATGGATIVATGSGTFPYCSGRAALLARDIETSFSNYPNPFVAGSEKTTITFYMPADGLASLRVFTVTGEPVRTIVEMARLRAGIHQEFSWDGRNGNGNAVLNGVYYLLLKVDSGGRDYTLKRKVALVR